MLYLVAATVAVAGIIAALVFPFGGVRVCVEFAGCHVDDTVTKALVAVIGLIAAGVLLAIAWARENRWRRDARFWKPPSLQNGTTGLRMGLPGFRRRRGTAD